MKKRILTISLIILGLFIFTGCDKKTDDGGTTNTAFSMVYDSVNILPGLEFKSSSISETADYSEIPSCAFEGMDKVYKYKNVEITTATVNNKETVYSVYFLNSNITTDEGIKIGDSKTKLIETYKSDYDEFGSKISYTKENVEIGFIIEEDVITSIEYTLVIE